MIKSFVAIVVLFVAYLYILEEVGNWMTRDLAEFKEELVIQKAMSGSPTKLQRAEYRQALQRLALDDIIELAFEKEYSYKDGPMDSGQLNGTE